MIHIDEIVKTVATYLERHPVDVPRLAALNTTADITSRKTVAGHVTCSAVVVNPARQVLHIRHNALHLWLWPGGHLEADDVSLVDAAVREVEEETGIPKTRLKLVDEIPVDVDVHPIPAHEAKGEPAHQHFDLRFVFTVADTAVVRLQAEEVHDFAWLPLAEIRPERVRDRVTQLLGQALAT